MRLFNKVAIVGVGLIGGSLALAIKKKGLAGEIIGVSRHKKTLLFAKKKRIIDRGSQDINIIGDADLVILAMPISAILKIAPRISKIIKKGCIVTDVGSTKKEIVSRLGKIFCDYVGAHPLAGSEKRGVVNAERDIFKDSLCILTPTKNTKEKNKEKIRKLWSELGAKTTFLSVDSHDKILSFVSHLPHLVAFSLIGVIPKKYLKFAASGLKSTTRIAASDTKLWSDICLSNPENIVRAIELFQQRLSQLKSAIKQKDHRRLENFLKEANKKRCTLDS